MLIYKRLNKVLLFLLILFAGTPLFAGVGMSDWRETTPGGNTIDNFSGNGYILHLTPDEYEQVNVDNLKEWYFYNGHITGILKNGPTQYFTADEKSGETVYFKSEKEWKQYLNLNKLTPFIWTRWYSSDWLLFDDDFAFVMFMMFPITLPLLCIFIYCIFGAVKEHLSKNHIKIYRIVVFAVIILVLFIWVGDFYPQSF